MENQRVKAGDQVQWQAKIFGESALDVIWMKGDEAIDPMTAGIVIETKKDEFTSFTIKEAKRSDSGKYTVKMKKRLGDDSCTVELTVLGREPCLVKFEQRLQSLLLVRGAHQINPSHKCESIIGTVKCMHL